ncbi:hypothetical protein D3C73_807440 [compost metagenome]
MNRESTTASMGTMASTVVKVRLDATCRSFSSLARCRVNRKTRPALTTHEERGGEGLVAAGVAATDSAAIHQAIIAA